MKNRGYTLLELLGVIVILALFTTLVFPSVLNVIKKSSNQTDKLSMDLISNAADLYIEINANEFIKFNGNKYVIEPEELMDEGNLPSNVEISYIDNIDDKCIEVTYQDGFNYELKDKGTCEKLIQFDSVCKLASDSTVTEVKVGAKYNCKVDPNKNAYTFYVLTTPSNNTINLIMDRNINSDGTLVTEKILKSNAKSGVYNLVEWISKEDYIKPEIGGIEEDYGENGNWIKGPITAMNFLQEATKYWTNTSKMTIDSFNDEEGTSYKMKTYNTYARLPYYSEILNSNGSKDFLNENLLMGYWTLSADIDGSDFDSAWDLYSENFAYSNYVRINSVFGIRPVINLPITNSEMIPDEYQAVEYIERIY